MTARAVLLDALGTLVELQPPAPRLRALLEAEGFSVSLERAEAGFRAEIAYYLAHHLEGSDRAALDDLRDRCAAVMLEALELPGLDHASARRAMLGALEFRPYEDVEPALRALRARGADAGGRQQLGLLAGGLARARRPAGAGRRRGHLGRGRGGRSPIRGCSAARWRWRARRPEAAVHVGDSLENDVAGARAPGIRPVLV